VRTLLEPQLVRRRARIAAAVLASGAIMAVAVVQLAPAGRGRPARHAHAPATGVVAPSTGAAPRPSSTTAPPPAIPPLGTAEERALYTALMVGDHDGTLAGVPVTWSWARHAEVDNSSNGTLPAMTAWGQVYAEAGASEPPPTSVRVEIKDMRSYIWSRSRGTWVLIQESEGVSGMHYLDDFGGDVTKGADGRTEPDGGTSVSMVPGYNFHFWPADGRAQVTPGDVTAVITTFMARLIGPGAARAAYLANAGGDWWRTMTAAFDHNGPGGNNDQIGEGRFVALSPAWTTVGFYTGGP
jgi:hypothetical protein